MREVFKHIDIGPHWRLSMGRTTVVLPDELERDFRARVAHKYGGKKGALGKAIAEAMKLWLKREK